jgi:hypothetical protein
VAGAATYRCQRKLAKQSLRIYGVDGRKVLIGDHNPQTTKIYTKVDLDALRTLALPWPGGVP